LPSNIVHAYIYFATSPPHLAGEVNIFISTINNFTIFFEIVAKLISLFRWAVIFYSDVVAIIMLFTDRINYYFMMQGVDFVSAYIFFSGYPEVYIFPSWV